MSKILIALLCLVFSTTVSAKTIIVLGDSISASYGRYLERPVNREYGNYVEPYDKRLGDRFNATASFGYTYFMDTMESLTGTLAYAYMKEAKALIDGDIDTTSGLRKESIAVTLAWVDRYTRDYRAPGAR